VVGGGDFVPLGTTDAQAADYLHKAQVALHSLYGRDKSTANKLYDLMKTYGLSGGKPLFGSPPSGSKAKAAAAPILNKLWNKGGQDKADALDISHYFNVPAAQLLKAGGIVPASVNPSTISKSFAKSAEATAGNALSSLSPIAGLFQGNLWLRVAEVGVGLLLIAVGVAKLTNAVPIATKIAGVVK
jgi:hypothetical protein